MTNRAKVAHARAPHCSPIQSLLLAGILIALVPRIVTSLLSRLRIVIARFSLLAGRLGVHRAGRYQAEAGAPRRATPRLVRAQEAVRRRHSPVRTRQVPCKGRSVRAEPLPSPLPPLRRRRSRRSRGPPPSPRLACARRGALALVSWASAPEAQPRRCAPRASGSRRSASRLEAAVPARLGFHVRSERRRSMLSSMYISTMCTCTCV